MNLNEVHAIWSKSNNKESWIEYIQTATIYLSTYLNLRKHCHDREQKPSRI
jgi:hypothetical protein